MAAVTSSWGPCLVLLLVLLAARVATGVVAGRDRVVNG